MALFNIEIVSDDAIGGGNRADVLCEMGLAYATGRGRPVDLVAAHKWLNIAAIRARTARPTCGPTLRRR